MFFHKWRMQYACRNTNVDEDPRINHKNMQIFDKAIFFKLGNSVINFLIET